MMRFPRRALRPIVATLTGLFVVGTPVSCSFQAGRHDQSTPEPYIPPSAHLPMRPGVAELRDAMVDSLRSHSGLTYATLRAQHQPAYLNVPGLEVRQADYFEGFVNRFDLSSEQQAMLSDLGFTVVPRSRGDEDTRGPDHLGLTVTIGSRRDGRTTGPVDLYYQLFAADLPVFITADSILHAWHRSYEKLVEATERTYLQNQLWQALTCTIEALNTDTQARRDALLYLSVARILLEPDWTLPEPVRERCAELVAAVYAGVVRRVRLFGDERTVIDFSQFVPRGHYARWEDQQRYFRAMMWLGRVDLVLSDAQPEGSLNPRSEAAARALVSAVRRGGAEAALTALDTFYRVQVGRTNALSPLALLSLCDRHGFQDCAGPAAQLQELYQAWGAAAYSGRYRAPDRHRVNLRFFPQRFAVEAWITSNTTVPELAPPHPDGRTMASPLDVAFVLGSDRALEHLAAEAAEPQRENLPAMLHALRTAVRRHPPTSIDDTVYNHWLEALAALSKPTVDARYPSVMRTGVWHDRKLEAVLGSWVELRHDTLLAVEQSVGGIGCQPPRGYVEPVPELYLALAQAAAKLEASYDSGGNAAPSDGYAVIASSARAFLQQFRQTMERLAELAARQLAGAPLRAVDLDFLRQTVDRHEAGYAGLRHYDGWYAALFWTESWGRSEPGSRLPPHTEGGYSAPVVSDVHTDADAGAVLEAGVGPPDLLLVAIDTNEGTAIYAGPAYSLYWFTRPVAQRMTDNEWRRIVDQGELPWRPAFARRYRTGGPRAH